MLDNIARYVYAVYRLKGVSNAADELFVSRPAISAAVKKAESALGAPIFNRKTLPFTLTEEGKIYIQAVEEMMKIEHKATCELQNLNEIYSGTLRVAAGDPFSSRLASQIMRCFYQNYPQIDIHLMHADADKLYELLEKDRADIVFRPLEDLLQRDYPVTTLFNERAVVVFHKDTDVPEELRRCAISKQELLENTFPREKLVSDMSLFQNVKFVNIAAIPLVNKQREVLFGKYEVVPNIISSTNQLDINYNLMYNRFGALSVTDTQVALCPPDRDCLYVVLEGSKAQQPYSVVYTMAKRGSTRKPLLDFVETAKQFTNCENPIMKVLSY